MAFPHIFILSSSQVSKDGFLFPVVSLGTPLENGEGMKPPPLHNKAKRMVGNNVNISTFYLKPSIRLLTVVAFVSRIIAINNLSH